MIYVGIVFWWIESCAYCHVIFDILSYFNNSAARMSPKRETEKERANLFFRGKMLLWSIRASMSYIVIVKLAYCLEKRVPRTARVRWYHVGCGRLINGYAGIPANGYRSLLFCMWSRFGSLPDTGNRFKPPFVLLNHRAAPTWFWG